MPVGAVREIDDIARYLDRALVPLVTPDDLEPLVRRLGMARCVFLGEASHGTSDFYHWRRRITERLIADYGFSFVAVEGDWPECYRLNRYVKSYPESGASAYDVLHAFTAWPTWMWANHEVAGLAEWLREHNKARPGERRAGIYGLDVYSLWESMQAVIEFLDAEYPSAVAAARQAYGCFEPYDHQVQSYAWATAVRGSSCEDEVVRELCNLRSLIDDYPDDGRESYFSAEQNALIARDAERYYRTMIRSGPESWNVRDRHMHDTLQRLLDFYGTGAKGIVWAHNTHIGDARATDMAASGMFNLGQLARQAYGDDALLVGFGAHRGAVIAAREWGGAMERMVVPPAAEGSWEAVVHAVRPVDSLLLFDDPDVDAPEAAHETRGHRAIGVVYDPATESGRNYVPTRLLERYDAFIHVEESRPLRPLHMSSEGAGEMPETYPWGV